MDVSQSSTADGSRNNMLNIMLLISSRIQALTDLLLILEGRYNDPESVIDERCVDLFASVASVRESMTSMRNVLKQLMDEIKIMSEHVQKLKDMRKYMEYIKNHLQEGLPQAAMDIKNVTLDINGTINSNFRGSVSPVPSSWSQLESPCVNKVKSVHPVSVENKKKDLIKKENIPAISYVTETEVNTVPKYMRGRLNAININRLVDSFNMVYKKKYETVRKPKRTIKPKDLDYYCEWKRDENMEPKGTFFVTVNDLNTFGNMKMDKSAFNMVTILRHLKRIRETRHTNGQVHFILL